MCFQTPGEKLKEIRRKLNIRQEGLEVIGVTRNFISMVESNKRKMSQDMARGAYEILEKRALELGEAIDLDCNYLALSPKEAAERYCIQMLEEIKGPQETEEIINLAAAYSLFEQQAKAYTTKANMLYDKRQYKEAIINYYNALDLYTRLKSDDNRAFLYNKMGKCKSDLLDYEEALNYFEKSYYYSIKYDCKEIRENTIFDIALTNYRMNKLDIALDYIERYISLLDIDEQIERLVDANILKTNCYIGKQEYDTAIAIYDNLIPRFQDATHKQLGLVYHNLALIYYETDLTNKALEYANRSIVIKEVASVDSLSATLILKSKIFFKLNMIDQAVMAANNALELAKQYGNNKIIIDSYHLLEIIYEDMKDLNKLQGIYLGLINDFNSLDKREESLKTYIKLSMINHEKDMELSKFYLKEALSL
jgi:tetratricopeptide (TPR) repeat protein